MQIEPTPPNYCLRNCLYSYLHKARYCYDKIKEFAVRIFEYLASFFRKKPEPLPEILPRPVTPPLAIELHIIPNNDTDSIEPEPDLILSPPSSLTPFTPERATSAPIFQQALNIMQATPSPRPILSPPLTRQVCTSPTQSTASLESWVVES